MATILIVDDELSMREFLTILLEKEGFRALTAEDGASALKKIASNKIDLLLSDIRMPGIGGLSLLEKTKAIDSSIPVIMMTAYASPEDAVNAMKNGAYDYITKPFKVDEIKRVISSAITTKETSSPPELNNSTSFAGIIGQSPEMLQVFDLIKRISPTHANVMIYGESGTGKELVARAIHNYSNVSGNPFVPITCSAIPESLIESELFGHVKGSFTGAINNKRGLFEHADNGSAFLDEIGDVSPHFQAKLLRFLEQKEYERVGDSKTLKADVRVVAATNQDLVAKVSEKKFREDLFYRLKGVLIQLPLLSERGEDIPLLASHFMRVFRKSLDKNIESLAEDVTRIFLEYSWPGNVRELKSVIQYACALCPEEVIQKEHLPPEIFTDNALERLARRKTDRMNEAPLDRGSEKESILAMLEKTDWNKAKAARLLGVSRATLYTKLLKHSIETKSEKS